MKKITISALLLSFAFILIGCNNNTYSDDLKEERQLIENFITTKRAECRKLAAIPHPAEFDCYYNL